MSCSASTVLKSLVIRSTFSFGHGFSVKLPAAIAMMAVTKVKSSSDAATASAGAEDEAAMGVAGRRPA